MFEILCFASEVEKFISFMQEALRDSIGTMHHGRV